jgi:phosphatidylinositol dimannoside acyltransferase
MTSGRLGSGLRRTASTAAEHAVATGFVAGWRLVRTLPEDRAHRMFEQLADRIHRKDGRAVRRLRSNLHRVRPDLDAASLEELTHRGVRSYLRYWCESFRLPAWPLDDLVARTRTVHEDRLRTPYDEGRGVVVALPHQGNWDWAGAWACGTGMPLMTVAERLRPERLYDEFVAYRSRLGMRILPLGGERPPMPRLEEYLRQGGFVCLLADRDLSRNAVDVTLCGAPARMPPGPAVLARDTGAALVPATLAYVGRDLEIHFHEEVRVRPGAGGVAAAMQEVADAFTLGITAHPEDWHMMQRVFGDDLGSEG